MFLEYINAMDSHLIRSHCSWSFHQVLTLIHRFFRTIFNNFDYFCFRVLFLLPSKLPQTLSAVEYNVNRKESQWNVKYHPILRSANDWGCNNRITFTDVINKINIDRCHFAWWKIDFYAALTISHHKLLLWKSNLICLNIPLLMTKW